MHVGTKKLAVAGLLSAVVVVMLILSSVIESNSLFFIAAASFCVGIAIREFRLKLGLAFLVATTLLNLFFAPNKFYCITYAGMGLYIWLSEILWELLAENVRILHRKRWLWIGKYVIFNIMYISVLFLMPKLIFSGKINGVAVMAFLLIGQVALFVYDMAYQYFQARIWGRFRSRLIKES